MRKVCPFKMLSKLCIFGLLLNIFGCATENAPLSKLPQTTLILCVNLLNNTLNKDDGCYVDVLAKKPENNIGLMVKKGQEYRFIAKGNQFWYDKSRLNRPLCGEPGSWLMNSILIFKEKKSSGSLWFSLIAELKGEDKPYDLCPKNNKHISGKLRATGEGELILYANDIEGFYDNNRGQIRIEIFRIK